MEALPAPAFADRYQVIVYDHRGVGQSGAPGGFYSTRRFAHDAKADGEKKPELLEKVLKSMIEGISIFKTNKEKTYRFGANISGARATTFWRKPINRLWANWSGCRYVRCS